MEQHFQDVSQKVRHDNDLEKFADHFAEHLIQVSRPQQCCDIISLKYFVQ